MDNLLILGNGKVSKKTKEFISMWKDEIWGFNLRFLDPSITLDKVFVDNFNLFKALEYQTEFGKKFDILCKDAVLIPENTLKLNSHVLAVFYALLGNYDSIYVGGISLGDSEHEKRNKANWIRSWKRLKDNYDLGTVTFLDTDYKKVIEDTTDSILYGEEIPKDFSNSVLILGNGTSRQKEPDVSFIQNWRGELWGCNGAYKEDLPFTRIGVMDKALFKEIRNYKDKNFLLYSRKGNTMFHYNERKGNTGYLWILQALHEGFDKIYLSGFDFGGDDIYTKFKSGVSFRKRFGEIVDEFGLDKICFVNGFPDFLT